MKYLICVILIMILVSVRQQSTIIYKEPPQSKLNIDEHDVCCVGTTSTMEVPIILKNCIGVRVTHAFLPCGHFPVGDHNNNLQIITDTTTNITIPPGSDWCAESVADWLTDRCDMVQWDYCLELDRMKLTSRVAVRIEPGTAGQLLGMPRVVVLDAGETMILPDRVDFGHFTDHSSNLFVRVLGHSVKFFDFAF